MGPPSKKPAHRPGPPSSPTVPSWQVALRRAWQARRSLLPPHTNIYRLLHDAGDGVPGLVVDAAGPVAMVQAYDAAWLPKLEAVGQHVLGLGFQSARCILRGKSGMPDSADLWVGSPPPEEFTATEAGMAFQLRCRDSSLSWGLFPDARVARARVRALSNGQNVLNLFAYAGGFTVAAMHGGAAQVDQVDVAGKVASWSARNVAVNGFSPSRCRFIVEDALAYVGRAATKGRSYGVTILDPPTFGRSASGWHTTAGLRTMLANTLAITATGGRMLYSVNTKGLDVRALWGDVEAAAQEAKADVVLEESILAGPDHPVHVKHPELERFKMVVVRVER